MIGLLDRMDSTLANKLCELNEKQQSLVFRQLLGKSQVDLSKCSSQRIDGLNVGAETTTEVVEEAFWALIMEDFSAEKTDRLNERLQGLLEKISSSEAMWTKGFVRSIPLNSRLLQALEARSLACQKADIPFRSTDLLLALLSVKDSLTTTCLDKVKLGLGAAIREALEKRYSIEERKRAETGALFRPFDWSERSDVQKAQSIAFDDGYPVVTEKHLLIGFLEFDSNTARWLRGTLGNTFQALLDTAYQQPARSAPLDKTPFPEHFTLGDMKPSASHR